MPPALPGDVLLIAANRRYLGFISAIDDPTDPTDGNRSHRMVDNDHAKHESY